MLDVEMMRRYVEDRKHSWEFTLESGRGETYANGKPTLYGHSEYPDGSVLAGRPLRRWLCDWNTPEEAYIDLRNLADKVGFTFDDRLAGGSSHMPVASMVSLPQRER